MNMFKKEFSMKVKSVATWAISIFILMFAFMSLYPSFGSADAGILDDPYGQYASRLVGRFWYDRYQSRHSGGVFGLYLSVCPDLPGHSASNYGFGLISIEERELTADFLLAKPVSRTQVMTSKLLAALAALTITNLTIWVSTLLAINLFNAGNSYQLQPFIWMLASILPFQLFSLAVGMLISCWSNVYAVSPRFRWHWHLACTCWWPLVVCWVRTRWS